MLGMLSAAEQHAVISTACDRLFASHQGMNNFYNEPPFAARLHEIVESTAVPDSVRNKFVETVVTCAIGNQYGVSWAASSEYEEMTRDFSPKAFEILFAIPKGKSLAPRRMVSYKTCRNRFAGLVGLLEGSNIPTALKADYDAWMKELAKLNAAA